MFLWLRFPLFRSSQQQLTIGSPHPLQDKMQGIRIIPASASPHPQLGPLAIFFFSLRTNGVVAWFHVCCTLSAVGQSMFAAHKVLLQNHFMCPSQLGGWSPDFTSGALPAMQLNAACPESNKHVSHTCAHCVTAVSHITHSVHMQLRRLLQRR